jgi:prephenate dehydrogenase
LGAGDAPVFPRIAIVGLGLIGGSIALAARQRWPGVRLVAVDEKPILTEALSRQVVDASAETVAGLPEVDLVVLAAPVRKNIEILSQLADTLHGPAVITDVGGTKQAIQEAAAHLPSPLTFVGGHPLGGGAHAGLAFARADLFDQRPWIFTPFTDQPASAVEQLSRFAAALGALPVTISAAEHDRIMAFLSHLPQLTASALMETVGQAVGAHGLGLAGGGLLDTTRLASSPASVWRDVCATNADAIGTALDRLIEQLGKLRADLERGQSVEEVFSSASKWRAELIKK